MTTGILTESHASQRRVLITTVDTVIYCLLDILLSTQTLISTNCDSAHTSVAEDVRNCSRDSSQPA